MAYDEGLAERIRTILEEEQRVTEKKMFGGVAFLLDGKMFVGIVKHDLMVRVGPDRYEESLKRRHVRPMDFTGKPMAGYVYVAPDGVSEDDELAEWVRLGAQFVRTLTGRTPGPAKRRTKEAARVLPAAGSRARSRRKT
jgi:TfoX/Sxy family transcriptional regulator of competence genes